MNDIQQAEQEVKLYQEQLSRAERLDKLLSNRDFKEFIINGYFKDEAVRLVSLKAHPDQQTPDKQAAILREIDAIGSLQGYLRMIKQQGQMAERSLGDAQDTLQMLIADEGN